MSTAFAVVCGFDSRRGYFGRNDIATYWTHRTFNFTVHFVIYVVVLGCEARKDFCFFSVFIHKLKRVSYGLGREVRAYF